LTQISRESYANSEFRSHQVVAHVGRWAYGMTSKNWSYLWKLSTRGNWMRKSQ